MSYERVVKDFLGIIGDYIYIYIYILPPERRFCTFVVSFSKTTQVHITALHYNRKSAFSARHQKLFIGGAK